MSKPVVLVHASFDADHLDCVINQMRDLGSPTLRAVDNGSYYSLLEGCHRTRAAKELNIPINLVIVTNAYNICDDDDFDANPYLHERGFDFDPCDRVRLSDIANNDGFLDNRVLDVETSVIDEIEL